MLFREVCVLICAGTKVKAWISCLEEKAEGKNRRATGQNLVDLHYLVA